MKIEFLGSGTSQGVPIIACHCPTCSSSDPRDKRLRASILVTTDSGLKILVDAGPDFRYQMLRAGCNHLDAILLTHCHKDHTGGLDDVRALNWIENLPAEIYCEAKVLESLKGEYSYAFETVKYPGAPEWNIHLIDEEPFSVVANVHEGSIAPNPIEVIPIRGMHYKMPVLGFRFGDFAYCTDMNFIPESEFAKLQGVDTFVINTVRFGTHISHFGFQEAIDICHRVGARQSYLTHLSHQLPPHTDLLSRLKRETILPAYDGLVITL